MPLRRSILLLALIFGLGCEDRAEPVALDSVNTGSKETPSIVEMARARDFDILQAAGKARTTDAFFDRIHDAVPGFAGLTFEDGIPTVYLVDEGRADLATSVMARFFSARGKAGRGVRFREAEFGWGELYEWRNKARSLFDLPELRSLGIST